MCWSCLSCNDVWKISCGDLREAKYGFPPCTDKKFKLWILYSYVATLSFFYLDVLVVFLYEICTGFGFFYDKCAGVFSNVKCAGLVAM